MREERRGGEVASISLFLALVHLLLPCSLLGGRTNGGITALGALGVGPVHNPGSIRVGLSLHEHPQSCVLSSQPQVHLLNQALFLLISSSFP